MTDPLAKGRRALRRALPDLAASAADRTIPGGAIGVRAVLAAIDEVRFAEIVEEAAVQTVLASIELCDEPLLTKRLDGSRISGLFVSLPWLTLRQFARALEERQFAPSWSEGPRSWIVAAQIAQTWDDVPAALERARRTYNTELGGSYLLPKAGAAAINKTRSRLREAIGHATSARRAASHLSYLSNSGGLAKYVRRANEDCAAGTLALMFALNDILAAHEELIEAARQVTPDRIRALFAKPDSATVAANAEKRQRVAAEELLDNAKQALVDAGEEMNGWREHSSLRDTVQVDLCIVAASPDLDFDEQRANCWLQLGHVIDSARSRLESLTSGLEDDLGPTLTQLRDEMLRHMRAADGRANDISTRYRAFEDAARQGRVEPLDAQGIATARTEFFAAAARVCASHAEIEASVMALTSRP